MYRPGATSIYLIAARQRRAVRGRTRPYDTRRERLSDLSDEEKETLGEANGVLQSDTVLKARMKSKPS
jgi:hypothetical protein